jgi:hypothetical protein
VNSNKPSLSLKGAEFVNYLTDCSLLRKEHAVLSTVVSGNIKNSVSSTYSTFSKPVPSYFADQRDFRYNDNILYIAKSAKFADF